MFKCFLKQTARSSSYRKFTIAIHSVRDEGEKNVSELSAHFCAAINATISLIVLLSLTLLNYSFIHMTATKSDHKLFQSENSTTKISNSFIAIIDDNATKGKLWFMQTFVGG